MLTINFIFLCYYFFGDILKDLLIGLLVIYIIYNETRLNKFIKNINYKLSRTLWLNYKLDDFSYLREKFKNLSHDDIVYIFSLILKNKKLDAVKYFSDKEGVTLSEAFDSINKYF